MSGSLTGTWFLSILWLCQLHYITSRVATERERAWRITHGRFVWPVLEVVDITSAFLPLARTQSHGHTAREVGKCSPAIFTAWRGNSLVNSQSLSRYLIHSQSPYNGPKAPQCPSPSYPRPRCYYDLMSSPLLCCYTPATLASCCLSNTLSMFQLTAFALVPFFWNVLHHFQMLTPISLSSWAFPGHPF